jgi:membrane-bound ClpP family serine protease
VIKTNPRIVIAVITSLVDEIMLFILVLWVLPALGINVPLWLVIPLAVIFLASGTWTLLVVRKKPNLGFENQIGARGVAITDIEKKGLVKIGRENWTARTGGPKLERGSKIVVVEQNALILTVAPDKSES